jgi:hypothetical protein
MATSDQIQLKLRLLKADLEEFKGDFNTFASKTEGRFDKLYELMDGLAGDFKKFDEEQIVLSGNQTGHTDRLEQLEKKVFGHISL